MLECGRREALFTCTVLLSCFLTNSLCRATPLPPEVSSTDAPPSVALLSPATELLEPDEATGQQTTSNLDFVVNYDVKKFLQNYGYMPTYNPSKGKWEYTERAKTPWLDTPTITETPSDAASASPAAVDADAPTKTTGQNDSDSLALEERTKFEQALESFQRRYKLQVTGAIDEETLQFMQRPRCGVPDYTSKFESKLDPKAAASKADLGDKLDVAVGKSTSKAAISNDSGAFGGTLGSKAASVSSGRSTVSSPAAKAAARTQDSTLSHGALKASEPISVSDLLLKTMKPKADGKTLLGSTQETAAYRTTEVTEIVTDIVTVEAEEQITTISPRPTTSLTTATTPLLDVSDLPRNRRSLDSVLNTIRANRAKIRTKRDYYYDDLDTGSSIGFNKDTINWRILTSYYSIHFSPAELRSQIAQAFRRWAEILPLKFVEMPTGDILNVDIQIAFLDHTNSQHDFNFNFMSDELARSTSPRSIHFNDDIQWTYNQHQGKNLIKVAVHEVGHVLGLWHSDDPASIMFPFYIPFDSTDYNFRVIIDDESRLRAQALHGVCTGSFDTILDWVRTVGNRRKYSSVFFRGDTMWVYENTYQRVKYADPRHINDMWPGVPTDLDAAVQILPRSSSVDNLYFFKGNRYYQYDNDNRQLMTTDPVTGADISNGRLISEGWPAKPNFPRIPDNIDTAYFDKRDGNVYFFKGDQVYAYDMQAGGCCLSGYPMAISTAYPYRYSSGGLPSNIDAAYYSIYSRTLFFFQGEKFWENETYNPSANTVVNRVGPQLWWDEHWYDICEA